MKTITIPLGRNPFVANINGVMYSYTAGSVQDVPDEVASLIEQISAMNPDGGSLPGKIGDVLTVTEKGPEYNGDIPDYIEKLKEMYEYLYSGEVIGKVLYCVPKAAGTIKWLDIPNAEPEARGVVKMAHDVDDATDAEDIVEQFNKLLENMREAGLLVHGN